MKINMKLLPALVVLGFGLSQVAKADTTTVNWDGGDQFVYSNAAKSVKLTAGGATVASDGAVLQLGYYSLATTTNYFAGTFIPLTGAGSANVPFRGTTIGDDYTQGAVAGDFYLTNTFTLNSTTTGNNLPAAGTPLAVRFYNGTTLANSTLTNSVSDSLWLWQTPTPASATVNVSLDDVNLQWLGGAASAFYTSQAVVPEPSTYLISLLGATGLIVLAKRTRFVARN